LETQRVCKYYNVETVVTNDMFANGQKFNKGLAVNAGLKKLDFKEWCVHVDADIILPPMSRHLMEQLPLNEQFLYGVDRMMCPTYEDWERFINNPMPQHDMAYVYADAFPLGIRLSKIEQGGYVPLGYFQMFHRNSNFLRNPPYYPAEWDTAATSDLFFAYKWPRTHRHLLPEIIAIHLATDDVTNAPMGVNWEGRQTSRFGPRDQRVRRVVPAPEEKK
jgi:hypothetical protein